jgi:hypothetical protein
MDQQINTLSSVSRLVFESRGGDRKDVRPSASLRRRWIALRGYAAGVGTCNQAATRHRVPRYGETSVKYVSLSRKPRRFFGWRGCWKGQCRPAKFSTARVRACAARAALLPLKFWPRRRENSPDSAGF